MGNEASCSLGDGARQGRVYGEGIGQLIYGELVGHGHSDGQDELGGGGGDDHAADHHARRRASGVRPRRGDAHDELLVIGGVTYMFARETRGTSLDTI